MVKRKGWWDYDLTGPMVPVKERRPVRVSLPRIYVVFDGRYCKVGITGNVMTRLSAIKTANPTAELVRVWKCPLGRVTELAVHGALEEHRVRGEWFAVTPEEAITAVEQALSSRELNST